MKNLNLEKGNKLETAVELIEKVILNNNPDLKEGKLTIEPKKILMIEGVRYEIDLYVEIDQNFGYKSIYLFECKNWEDKVKTEEITKFSDKIKVAKAQKGFFVAKSYTSSAEAKAKIDKRINLLYVDDSPIEVLPFLKFEFINKMNKINSIEVVAFGVKDTSKKKKKIIDFEKDVCIYKGKEVIFRDFIMPFIESMYEERIKKENLALLSEGKYSYNHTKEFNFLKEELCFKVDSLEKDMEKIRMNITFDIELKRPKVVSKIDVLTRGRVIEYESVKTSTGGEVKFAFVILDKQSG